MGLLLVPTNFLFAVGILAIALIASGSRALGAKLLVAVFLSLLVLCVTPIGSAFLLPLEDRFPAWSGDREPHGIIVLGGGLNIDVSASRNEPVSGLGVDRILYTAKLARDFPAARIIYSGGSSSLTNDVVREADQAIRLFTYFGIPTSRIELERSARNTTENAAFVRALVANEADKHWLLVTSAFHMPRSVGLFRKTGLSIDPVPVGWLTRGRNDLTRLTFGLEGLVRVNVAIREWVGLSAAWVTGQTTEFLPGPAQTGRGHRFRGTRDELR